MDINNFPSNSNKEKDTINKVAVKPEKRTQAVVTGATTKKRSAGRRFADLFLSENVGDVKEYLIYDLLIPAIKNTFVDTLNKSIDMLFYGRVRAGSNCSTNRPGQGTYVSYNSMSSNKPQGRVENTRPTTFDSVYVDTRVQAEQILDELLEINERYGEVRLADYYDACGVSGNGHTDQTWGWKDLRAARVVRDRNGYTIELPRIKPLD